MKKVKYVAMGMLFLGMMTLTSCKKEWQCSCTDTYKDTGNSYTELDEYIIKGKNKKEANRICVDDYNLDNEYYKTECKAVSVK